MNHIGNLLSEFEIKILQGLRILWDWMKRHPLWSIVIIITPIFLYFIISYFVCHFTGWADWSGLGPITTIIISPHGKATKEISPGKTCWDFLVFILGGIGAWFIYILNERNQDRQEKGSILRIYLDDIGKLIEERKTKRGRFIKRYSASKIIQAKTITVLHNLDKNRRDQVILFLISLGLSDNILVGAALHDLDLSGNKILDLNLSKTGLFNVNLQNAYIINIKLNNSTMLNVDMSGVCSHNVILSGSCLTDVNLSNAFLQGIDLSGTELKNPNLFNTDFKDAILRNAIIPPEQLSKVKSLKGAIMPDGSIHE